MIRRESYPPSPKMREVGVKGTSGMNTTTYRAGRATERRSPQKNLVKKAIAESIRSEQ